MSTILFHHSDIWKSRSLPPLLISFSDLSKALWTTSKPLFSSTYVFSVSSEIFNFFYFSFRVFWLLFYYRNQAHGHLPLSSVIKHKRSLSHYPSSPPLWLRSVWTVPYWAGVKVKFLRGLDFPLFQLRDFCLQPPFLSWMLCLQLNKYRIFTLDKYPKKGSVLI